MRSKRRKWRARNRGRVMSVKEVYDLKMEIR